MSRRWNVTVERINAVNGKAYNVEHVSVPAELIDFDNMLLRQHTLKSLELPVNRLDTIAGHLLQCPLTLHPFRNFEMNSFDEIQCEETADAQMCFSMEEMAIYQEWLEQREREAQQELDEIFDELFDAEIDF